MSTTRRRADRGQILVLVAGGFAAILIIAALAFDVGMMLVERRDQQNAADAAALAGARKVLSAGSFHGECTTGGGNQSVRAACEVAELNGFDTALDDETVNVHIPPIHGTYRGMPGFIEVQIDATRPSVFGGIIGKAMWPVGAYAVAANQPNLTFPFSMLALDPTACKAIQVSGGGIIEAWANIHSNSTGSDCTGDPISFSRSGGATIDIFADDATCRAVGEIQDQGSGYMTCIQAENSFVLPDPLRRLAPPPKPTDLAPVLQPVGHTKASPDWCPGATGSKAPREDQTQPCDVGGNGSSYADLGWILSPGLYPAGLNFTNGVTAYLLPGIYWIGGGGISVSGGASVISIAAAADAPTTTAGGGVLIYNSKLPTSAGGAINQNSTSATMKLEAFYVAEENPLHIYNDIVIFQDRSLTTSVTLNGSSSTTHVDGLIYVPNGEVKLNGNGGTLEVDQIIAGTYLIDGNSGTIRVTDEAGIDAIISGAGLVE